MKTRWTPRLDKILRAAHRRGDSYRQIAREIRRATRGSFQPHPSTCQRRLVWLEAVPAPRPRAEPASTRVDTRPIPPRTRAPLAARLPPPPVTVLALPSPLVEHSSVLEVVAELLCAAPAGWAWEILPPDVSRADAIACAKHQARLRGDLLEVVENLPGAYPLVVLRRRQHDVGSWLVLVVVRFVCAE